MAAHGAVRGCFLSAGSIRDTLAVIDYLMADTNYHIDRRHIFLLGHSYGAPVIARAMEQRPSIFGGIFLMPYDLGRAYLMSRTNSKVSKGLMQLLQEGAEILPDTSSEQLYQEIQKQPDNYSYFPWLNFSHKSQFTGPAARMMSKLRKMFIPVLLWSS